MGDHRLHKRIMSVELGKEWTDCEAEDRRLFGITRD